MQDRLGDEFDGLIVSVTKYGFFVELTELFVEGLVTLDALEDDHYMFHENTRQIIGGRTRRTFSIGDKVRVLADRIDYAQRRIQFALAGEATTARPHHKPAHKQPTEHPAKPRPAAKPVTKKDRKQRKKKRH